MKRVLIADDERSLRLLVRATLESSEIEVVEAEDGEEALRLVQSQRLDLVLLDVQMPDLSGFDVCQQIKSDPGMARLPVIMLTAQSHAAARERGIQAGADEYLTKPFSPLQLLTLVESLLNGSSI